MKKIPKFGESINESTNKRYSSIQESVNWSASVDGMFSTSQEKRAAMDFAMTTEIRVKSVEGEITYDSTDLRITMTNGDVVLYEYRAEKLPTMDPKIEFAINGRVIRGVEPHTGDHDTLIGDLLAAYRKYSIK